MTVAWVLQVGTLFNHRFAEALEIKHEQENSVESAMNGVPLTTTTSGPEEMARAAREQSRALAALPTEERSAILLRIADALEERCDEVMAANARDMAAATGKIDNHLLQRLALKPQKITQLAEGIRQLAKMDEPIGKLLSKTEIAQVRAVPPPVPSFLTTHTVPHSHSYLLSSSREPGRATCTPGEHACSVGGSSCGSPTRYPWATAAASSGRASGWLHSRFTQP